MLGSNDLTTAGDHQPLHQVFQLANVAGPFVFGQEIQQGRLYDFFEVVAAVEIIHKVPGQKGNFVSPFPQGMDVNRYYIQAVV